MNHLQYCLHQLAAGRDLSEEEAEQAIYGLVQESTHEALVAGLLTALRVKGESERELLGCARALRSMCRTVDTGDRLVLDTCGTGGDGSSSLNISTLAALVLASAGVAVAKHGNRSVTSRCGSADLIEALGLPLLREPDQVLEHLDRFGFAFLFAPHFHPATARVGAVRRELGIRTVFNLLGPLVNPARASFQVIGVFAPEWCAPVAKVAGLLGVKSCLVVHGEGGWDELTPWGPSRLAWWKEGELIESILDPRSLDLLPGGGDKVQGHSPVQNALESERVLRGELHPATAVVALNAAAGLLVAGRASSWLEAYQEALSLLRSGRAWKLVENLRCWSG